MAVPRLDVPAAGEGPILRVAAVDVVVGGRIDLATGTITSGPEGDLEAARGPGGALLLRPREGAVLSPARRGPVASDDVTTWSLPPEPLESTLLRSVRLRPGDWVTFRSERGGAGRLELEAPFTESGWRLKILTVPGIAAHIPRPPEAPPVMEKDGWTVRLSCAPLSRLPEGRSPVHVLDREQPFGSGRWERIAEHVGSGSPSLLWLRPGTGRCPSRAFECVAGSTAERSPSRGRPSLS